MEIENKCPLCKQVADVVGQDRYYWITCQCCGTHNVTDPIILYSNFFTNNKKEQYRYLLSAAARKAFERNQMNGGRGELLSISPSNIEEIAKGIEIERGVIPAASTFLVYLCEKQKSLGDWQRFDRLRDYPLAICRNGSDFLIVVNYLVNAGLVAVEQNEILYDEIRSFSLRLTAAGFEQVAELNKIKNKTNAFVAMWFDPKETVLQNAYETAMKTAIEEATTLKPVRADKEHFNDDINDWIISQIRQSAFIIADFTGNRGGVYLEAGYAMGLGVPVIFTCFDSEKHKKELHFDTNHKNHIFWKTPEELHKKLVDRIKATIPLEYLS